MIRVLSDTYHIKKYILSYILYYRYLRVINIESISTVRGTKRETSSSYIIERRPRVFASRNILAVVPLSRHFAGCWLAMTNLVNGEQRKSVLSILNAKIRDKR